MCAEFIWPPKPTGCGVPIADKLPQVYQVVHSNHACTLDRLVLKKRLLDFLGANIRAVVNNDLLLATAEPHVPARVDRHDVARVKPTVDYSLCGGVRTVPIADHIAWRLDPHSTFGACGHFAALVVPNRGRKTGSKPADRADAIWT
jgi:hypothetical protein